MRGRALFLAVALLLSRPVHAQMTWQPTAPPLVTAESTSWFQAAEPIIWNGDFYYPAGASQGFNQYQMVRSGSFRGIPLYTDTTIEPYSIVFVPIAGGRVQPYERRRSGMLAGTTGSRAPSLPTEIGFEGSIATPIPQAAAPPTYARAYDLAAIDEAVPTSGRARVTGTEGASHLEFSAANDPGWLAPQVPATLSSAIPPTGVNGIWIEFDGRRWFADGKSIAYDAARLNQIGTYHGFSVYALRDDAAQTTIYVPSIPGRLMPYRLR